MGLKLLSKTSILFQRVAPPAPKLDASDWQVPGVHPKRADAGPSAGAYVLKTRGLSPGLIVHQSLSRQPRVFPRRPLRLCPQRESDRCRGASADVLLPAPPITGGPSQRLLCGAALPVFTNLGNIRTTFPSALMAAVSYREDMAPAKSAFSPAADTEREHLPDKPDLQVPSEHVRMPAGPRDLAQGAQRS